MGANEELFGLEQSRGWHKVLEKIEVELKHQNNSLRSAVKRGVQCDASYALGWIEALESVKKIPSYMMKTLPKEK